MRKQPGPGPTNGPLFVTDETKELIYKLFDMELHEIDAHLAAHFDVLEKDIPTKKALTIPDICAIYQAVKPILKFARAILFFKPKWQSALDKLMNSLDQVCPAS